MNSNRKDYSHDFKLIFQCYQRLNQVRPYFESDETDNNYPAIVPFTSILTMSIESPTCLKFRVKGSATGSYIIGYNTPAKCQSDIDNYKAYLEDQHHANHLN